MLASLLILVGLLGTPAWAAGPILITGSDAGGGPHVRLFDAQTGLEIFSFFAYAPSFTGGVRVSQADVNGDGVPDVITSPGSGGGPHVRVFDGAALRNLQIVELTSLFAYSPSFTGGVFVGGGNASARPAPQVVDALGRLVGRTALVQPQFASVAVTVGARLVMLTAGRNGFPVQSTLFFPGVTNCTGTPHFIVSGFDPPVMPPMTRFAAIRSPGATLFVENPNASPTVFASGGSEQSVGLMVNCNPNGSSVTAVPAISLGDLHALRTPPFAYQ